MEIGKISVTVAPSILAKGFLEKKGYVVTPYRGRFAIRHSKETPSVIVLMEIPGNLISRILGRPQFEPIGHLFFQRERVAHRFIRKYPDDQWVFEIWGRENMSAMRALCEELAEKCRVHITLHLAEE